MSANEVRAGRAFVEVYTKDNTAAGLSGIKSKLASFGTAIAKVGGIAVTAAASGIAAAVMKTVSTGANIQDIADRFSLSTKAVQELGYAAQQSGASLDSIIAGIRNMQKGLGGGLLGEEMKQLGISLVSLQSMSPDKQFGAIAEAIGRLPDAAQKTALAMKIFGKSGADLIPLLRSGEGGVKALSQELNDMGAVMSEQAVKEAAELDDAIGRLGTQFNALVVAIGLKFLPLIKETTDFLSRSLKPPKPEAARGPGRFAPDGRWIADPQFNLMPKPGNGQSALAEFMRSLRARLEVANTTAQQIKIKDGLDAVWNALRDNGLRRRDVNAIPDLPAGVFNGIWRLAAGVEKAKSDMATFGTFDARDIAGGGYLQATQQQLSELKAIKEELKRIAAKKPGVPWG